MGKVVDRKKKKGRPSLLDLQKRSLEDQQEQQQQRQQHQHKKRNPNPSFRTSPITQNSVRRSTRRNPNPDDISQVSDNNDTAGEDDDDELNGKRREKKLKLVLKLPSQRSPLNSTSLKSGSYNSDSNAEDDVVTTNHKKRKINAIGEGSRQNDTEKAEKHVPASNPTNSLQGTQLDMGPSTSLPDKKLLLFILDRLQKKDSYGVFSEPVDPNELPDYHEVIEHPMDFGTVRKNLASGAYANLEQFEKDVFLICSNAMQYNAPDTIYFRQARSIQELAKRNFENLRQENDHNEPERKIVRRGRPPTKNLKKQMVRPALERAGSEFSLDATLATGAENSSRSNYDLRKGSLSDKLGPSDLSGRSFHGSHSSEVYSGWLAEHKFEKNDEFAGALLKGNLIKQGKKQVAFDENKRNTYKQSHLPSGGREPSVLTTFDGEKKQLMTVGLHSEYGYARSLARFAAILGPIAWMVASKKIEKSLPPGVSFGPGWVGEIEAALQRSLPLSSPPPVQLSSSRPLSGISSPAATPSTAETKGDKSSENQERENLSEKHTTSTQSALSSHSSKALLLSQSTFSSSVVANKSAESVAESAEAVRGLNSHTDSNVLSSSGGIGAGPPIQIHRNPVFHHRMNGVNGAYGFNLATQKGKVTGSGRPIGINLQSSQGVDTASRPNSNFACPVTANSLNSLDSKFMENSSTINSVTSLPNLGCEGFTSPRVGYYPQASWQEVSLQQKADSVPPDLNVRFRSPGSPNSSRVDSAQPDLVLQL
ncbi:hypothetical protein F0562_020925 [Nyssa sinensis]|uniref:Bromo domain-containing protein n=1 Tax=Nyssa sinensis TaxID=561372 RepID=A0A5J5BY53_9ASTE|nr:hypothetical protein F0562_020925 [Nyssa sinensis]